MKIGDTCFVHGYIDEIRKDVIIVRNHGGYFGTARDEVITGELPERKTGKWFLLDECANAGYYCSNCRKKVVKEGWSKTVKKINFCPNCGSDMRGNPDD